MKKWQLAALAALTAVTLTVVVPASAITNGQPDGNAHPYVGLVVFDVVNDEGDQVPSHRCSGSLLTPTVFLTAGHCTDGTVAARVWFDEIVQGNPEYPFSGATSYDGTPHTNPDFCIGCGPGLPGFAIRDVGVVVLTEPVPIAAVSQYAQLPAAGLVDTLANKTPVTLVGYGVQTQLHGGGIPVWTGPRVRLQAPSELVSGKFKHSEEFTRIALNPGGGSGGTCFGDSGGPDLLGTSNTVLSVNSYVTNSNCTGVGYSSRVDIPEVLSWIVGFM
ncbi:MAG TPA: trypsin-like serine protease [Gaiellaceae bacterium]|nr:trypsin-like serine protease [Gaiellaceae bacterium]